MNDLLTELRNDLQNEEGRYAYADTVTNAFVAAQIKELREDRCLTQSVLAQLVGTKQSGISRLQRTDYSAWKVDTLRKLARAFGVRLRIRFEEFGTLLDEIQGFDNKNLIPRRFEDDPVFIEPVAAYELHAIDPGRASQSQKHALMFEPTNQAGLCLVPEMSVPIQENQTPSGIRARKTTRRRKDGEAIKNTRNPIPAKIGAESGVASGGKPQTAERPAA
jgi:transcriptional regulator with XRE-family HTH domain